MKNLIITIFAIFGIALSVKAQESAEIIRSSFCISKHIDVILFEDASAREFPENANLVAKIDYTYSEYATIMEMTVNYNGREIKSMLLSNVYIVKFKKDGQTNYFITDNNFEHGGLFWSGDKLVCSFWTHEKQ